MIERAALFGSLLGAWYLLHEQAKTLDAHTAALIECASGFGVAHKSFKEMDERLAALEDRVTALRSETQQLARPAWWATKRR